MQNLIGLQGEKTLSEIGFTKQMVSMGHQACGSLELWNYPLFLRDLIPHDPEGRERPDHVDLAALEGTYECILSINFTLVDKILLSPHKTKSLPLLSVRCGGWYFELEYLANGVTTLPTDM